MVYGRTLSQSSWVNVEKSWGYFGGSSRNPRGASALRTSFELSRPRFVFQIRNWLLNLPIDSRIPSSPSFLVSKWIPLYTLVERTNKVR
jgi:hypothetical protein